MNTLHPKIQFTIEEESDGEVPFLDTLLKRKPDGTISVLVYRKPTLTDQYLNFKKSDITKVKKKMDRPRNDQQSDDAADIEENFISLPYIMERVKN